jgi:hypothetical protein
MTDYNAFVPQQIPTQNVFNTPFSDINANNNNNNNFKLVTIQNN